MSTEKLFTFFMVKKVEKVTITIYCLIIDPVPNYIFINFFLIESFELEFLDSLRVLF